MMTSSSIASFWCLVALTIVGVRLQMSSASERGSIGYAVPGSRPSLPNGLSRLRAAVQRIEQLASEVDDVLESVESSDEMLVGLSGPDEFQSVEEKRSKAVGGPGGSSKNGRRYDSYGVAGRFGRSVNPQ